MSNSIQTKGCLITLTSFSDDADKVAIPLVMANTAQAAGEDVLLWLSLEGVQLAKTGGTDHLQPKSFAPVNELLDNFISNGGRIGVCPPCGKTHGIGDDDLVANAEWMGAAALLEQSSGWRTLSF